MEASALRAPAGLTRLALPSALLRLRSDEQLVALFRQGSDDAFRVIHDRYRQRLFAYTRQMLGGSRSDAEDALQDVFLRAYNALRIDDRPVALKAWLYRVAHNRCVDHLRRPVPPNEAIFEVSRTPMADPMAEAERRDDLRRLVADVQSLPDQQRSALLMRELEGLSYADLADALDVTVPAVKSLLVRARIGLVEASEARNTACADIRNDLALSLGKGVRASATARRHMRDCEGCREYRSGLKGVSAGLGALSPAGSSPFALVAKLLGLGGAGGGAAAGGSVAAGGGSAAVLGGGAVAATTAKVAAVVCCAAITAGGAAEIKKKVKPAGERDGAATASVAGATASASATPRAALQPGGAALLAQRRAAPRAAAPAGAPAVLAGTGAAKRSVAPAAAIPPASDESISPHVAPAAATTTTTTTTTGAPATGGALAPDEPPPPTTADQPAGQGSGSTQGTKPAGEPTAVPATASPTSPPPASSGTSSSSSPATATTATSGTAPSGG